MAPAATCSCTKRGIVGLSEDRMSNKYLLTKFDSNIFVATEVWPKIQSLDGARRHFEYLASAILGSRKPHVTNIYPQTKFRANRSTIGRAVPVCVFPRWRPSAMLDLLLSRFGPPMASP